MIFLIAYLVPILNILFLLNLLPVSLLWLPLCYGFLIIPLMDAIGERLKLNFKPIHNHALANTFLYGMVPVLALNLLLMLQHVQLHGWNWLQVINAGIAMGAFGINTAHELVHRKNKWERALGISLLVGCNYSHFRIEHVLGHHRHVSTREDPATARLGETVYAFWVRSILMGAVSAWRIDRNRKSNQMIWLLAIQVAFAVLIYFYFGKLALIAHGVQSVIAIVLLETINYVEHYGLERKKISDIRYEPVNYSHSWDTAGPATNTHLWNLGMHANHHSVAYLPYSELKLLPGSSRLPFGYPAMVLLSLIPPAYMKLMNAHLKNVNRSTQIT